MKEVLADVMKQVSSLFDNVIVTGTEDSTVVNADDNKMFYLVANLKKPIPEFEGEFALGSLPLLSGLLNFASYKTDEAKFLIHRKDSASDNHVSEFEFRDRDGAKTKFKTISTRFVGDGKGKSVIGKIPWDVTLPMPKAKAAEITTLANMLMAGMTTDAEKKFSLLVEDEKLFITIGGGSEIKHGTTIFLTDGVDSKLLNSNKFLYDIPQFLSVLKRVDNSNCTVSFCSRGVVGISIETEHASYNYYIRGEN